MMALAGAEESQCPPGIFLDGLLNILQENIETISS